MTPGASAGAGFELHAIVRPVEPGLTDRERALLDVAIALAARLDVEATCDAVLDAAEQMFGATSAWILLHDRSANSLRTARFRGPAGATYAEVAVPSDRGIVGLAFSRRESVFVGDVAAETRWFNPERVHQSGLRSVFTVPLLHDEERIGVLGLDAPQFTCDTPPTPADVAVLKGIGALAAIGIKNARLFAEAEEDRQRLRRLAFDRRQLRGELGHLRQEVREVGAFSGVVGDSEPLRQVLSHVQVVAPADSTVLLIGETGTGKELIARAIHEQSRRCRSPFIAVNCAALPESLVESELFGHEKGAFTGALTRKLGKFELADRGTLFLDEIGDLPTEAQAKLLRVLQEHEVNRVGGQRPIPVNVRVVAATNQDLEALMQRDRFRRDLFYRLSVFPIVLPPLRERREDVPKLVRHFVERFANRQHTPVPRIPEAAMNKLIGYEWPGNIRELQNVIERAVILARGEAIRAESLPLRPGPGAVPTPTSPPAAPNRLSELPSESPSVLPFFEAERHAILRALDLTAWRISGGGGAAELLGLKPTTLHAKMKKLGIQRPRAGARATA
jgi:formate hydrogenlyase transcriptional activator